jgi:hypothetical protein
MIHTRKHRQDETGQWWYYMGSRNSRTRVYPKTCAICGQEFVPNGQAKGQETCSHSCAGKLVRQRSPVDPSKSPRYKQGRIVRKGYIWIYKPDHPTIQNRNNKKKYILEHRLVMEQVLGRLLEPYEQVHHINGIPSDNRPENLELWTKQHPVGVRVHDKHCPTCTCGE